jgi:8-oxo-dGTP diphosphatase
MFESWEECARREVLEECNLALEVPIFGHVTNDPMPDEKKHYVTIFMLATCKTTDHIQIPKNMEPDKCLGWNSYSWDDLEIRQKQGDLFGPLDVLVLQKPKAIADFLKLDCIDI